MKPVDTEKVISYLLKLPPGAPLSIAYKNAMNIDAIPKDPLSPISAARGADENKVSSTVLPILDLSGALPGYNN